MNLLSVLLQIGAEVAENTTEQVATNVETSYLQILFKGGWILAPIFLLLFISIYVMIERWLVLNRAGKKDDNWFARLKELLSEDKIDKAIKICNDQQNSYAAVIGAGLKDIELGEKAIEDAMQAEAGQQISMLENRMNYIGITASIAPMLGFLGTIFGVIRIFYNIALTNDLNIASISDGLYQKMICSGVGLFVGLIAYAAYYLINGRIDKVVANMEKYSNDTLRILRKQYFQVN
jgi:biopolymer transport protein ExbB